MIYLIINLFHYAVLFVAKVCDNALGTAKTIFIQRSRWLLAGLAVMVSDLIYLSVMKNIVTDGNRISMIIVAVAGGIGCALACLVTDKISKDRTYVNVIMSDNRDAMMELRDYLAEHHITNVAADSYTHDWGKTITITAYPETKAESRLINRFVAESPEKFKRLVQSGGERIM